MNVVITGGLGHIGSYLMRRLPDLMPGISIKIIDNLTTQRYSSLFNLNPDVIYEFIEQDLLDKSFPLLSAFDGADAVIHLAAITDAASSFSCREKVEKTNFMLTQRVADACCQLDIPMIMASSTSVYGTQAETVDEYCALEDLKPQSPYAETKLKEESFVQACVQKRNLRAVIFRFGTIFGVSPGMRFHTAVNKFCWQAVMGQPLTVWKTAYHQKRPYLFLDDAAQVVSQFMLNDLYDGSICNVVSENATVESIVTLIKRYVPSVQVDFVEHKIMNQLSYEVLNTKLDSLGIALSGRLTEGVGATIKLLARSNCPHKEVCFT